MTAAELDLPVPRNRDAEEAVVGSCMQDLRSFREAQRILAPEHFYDPGLEAIWRAMIALAEVHERIDPMMVMGEMSKAGTLERSGGSIRLADLITSPFTGVNVPYYARLVREAAQRRRLLQLHQRMAQAMLDHHDDHDALLQDVAGQVLQMELLVEERDSDAPVEGLMSWDELWARYPKTTVDWLIPDMLVAEDVFLLLAGEGVGKSWFTRQICLAAAAGVHPFHPDVPITPLRTLLVDLENAPAMVGHESKIIGTQVARLGQWDTDRAKIWLKEDGLDLRKRADAMLLERVIAETQPQIVGLGSLYKAFQRGRDDWDTAASETREVLDRLKRRYNCAFILEHHMPKASGGDQRPNSPYGSSEWMRWASIGRTIHKVGDNMYAFDEFRGDRMRRKLPVGLIRGGELPWTAIYDPAEVDFGRWPPKKPEPRAQNR